jgi:hypothetical protein
MSWGTVLGNTIMYNGGLGVFGNDVGLGNNTLLGNNGIFGVQAEGIIAMQPNACVPECEYGEGMSAAARSARPSPDRAFLRRLRD